VGVGVWVVGVPFVVGVVLWFARTATTSPACHREGDQTTHRRSTGHSRRWREEKKKTGRVDRGVCFSGNGVSCARKEMKGGENGGEPDYQRERSGCGRESWRGTDERGRTQKTVLLCPVTPSRLKDRREQSVQKPASMALKVYSWDDYEGAKAWVSRRQAV